MPPNFTRRTLLAGAAAAVYSVATSSFPGLSDMPTTHAAIAAEKSSDLQLWYEQPAKEWTEALPLGNGRLGAMIFGGVERERIQLNEDTLWAGAPYDPVNPEAAAALPEARRLIFAAQYADAAKLIDQTIMARPLKQMQYQTVGDLFLDFAGDLSGTSEYRRQLDLDSAIATTQFRAGGIRYSRDAFVSPVDQVIVLRFSADQPKGVSFTASFRSPQRTTFTGQGDDTLVLAGTNGSAQGIEGKLKFEARVRAIATGGRVSVENGKLAVQNADSVVLLIAIATSFKRFDDISGDPSELTSRAIQRASARSFDVLKSEHVASHQKWFRRVSIDLGTSAAAAQPTDQRILRSSQQDDPALAALYLQYARYLLISSSRPGTQPANLQGIWNDSMSPPWGSKWTININTQMNYWPADPLSLPECIEPLVAMVEDLAITGARTAKSMYGAGGWVCHHNTDLWRATAPIDGATWGMWPTGGAWLCNSLFDHYTFSGDLKYLARIYPLLKGSAQFFVDTLVEDPTHRWLVTAPSVSPENKHPHGASVCAGPTMDSQILRDLFSHCISAAKSLGRDQEFAELLAAKRDRLPPTQCGEKGQIQEWLEDWDAKAPEQDHRHVSHLYGLFPSSQIDPRLTPELAEGCKRTLNIRGDRTTGWAIAWRINLWARLLDGERAHSILKLLLEPSRTYPNLFDAHPPFQIDGNFGGASAITELLLQSHSDEIHLLPALPSAWPSGAVTGLRARGGCQVDLAWREGKLTAASIQSASDQKVRIRYRDKSTEFTLQTGRAIKINHDFATI